MPNWCYNNVTVGFDPEDEEKLRLAIQNGEEFFNLFVKRPPEFDEGDKWYEWNIQNWGTKWDATPSGVQWNDGYVQFRLETAWSPPIAFYESLEAIGYRVEAYYLEEGMCFVGHYEDGFDNYYEYGNMSADEMEQSLPSWVDDEFNIITNARDNEEYEMDISEDEDLIEQLEDIQKEFDESLCTPWFSSDFRPARAGNYQVQFKESSDIHLINWNKTNWILTIDSERDLIVTSLVDKWRGLTSEGYNQLCPIFWHPV